MSTRIVSFGGQRCAVLAAAPQGMQPAEHQGRAETLPLVIEPHHDRLSTALAHGQALSFQAGDCAGASAGQPAACVHGHQIEGVDVVRVFAVGAPFVQDWRAPSGLATPWTLEVLHELGYRYDSSFGDEDVPYWLGIAAGRTEENVELPWQWVLDDAAYFAYPGALRRASDVIDLWIDEFDAAYRETGYFMLVCHSRYIGRPARAAQLERLIEHIKGHEGVWFARCDELAEHVRGLGGVPRYPAPARLEE